VKNTTTGLAQKFCKLELAVTGVVGGDGEGRDVEALVVRQVPHQEASLTVVGATTHLHACAAPTQPEVPQLLGITKPVEQVIIQHGFGLEI